MSGYMSVCGLTDTGSDEATIPQTVSQASSAYAAETNEIEELEVEYGEEVKDKGNTKHRLSSTNGVDTRKNQICEVQEV